MGYQPQINDDAEYSVRDPVSANFLKVNDDGSINTAALAVAATSPFLSAAFDNAAASGDVPVVAAVAGKATRVYRLKISTAGATVIQVRDGATVLDTFNLADGGSVILPFSQFPWYETSVNSALIVSSSNAVQVNGRVEYLTN